MKQLSDNTFVPSRMYYYLLDWNEENCKKYITHQFSKDKLCDLNKKEFYDLFTHAISIDIKNVIIK